MRVLEAMRQQIEDKVVTISRAKGLLTFSVNFQLIAAMNPCPCGFYLDPQKACTYAPAVVTKYQNEFPVRSSTRLISILKCRAWITKSSAEIVWVNRAERFAHGSKPREIFNNPDLPIPNLPTSSATRICASGRYGNFASYTTKVGV